TGPCSGGRTATTLAGATPRSATSARTPTKPHAPLRSRKRHNRTDTVSTIKGQGPDAVVVLPEHHQLRDQGRVADRTRRRRTIAGRVVGARSHLQHAADGLDSERATLDDIVLVRVDERDYFLCWRSSSAPKKLAALFNISLARRSSRFSCS